MKTMNYTMLIGVKNGTLDNVAFSVLFSMNEHGMPDQMYMRNDITTEVVPRGNLPTHAEFLIRDNLRQGLENSKELDRVDLYISDFMYFDGIEVSQVNRFLFSKIQQMPFDYEGADGETIQSFMSRHGISRLDVRDIIAPAYGERTALIVGFDKKKLNPEINLSEVNPNNLYYLNKVKVLIEDLLAF